MKEKTLEKLLSLTEKIKHNSEDSPKLKKHWETYFNLAMHHLGFKPKSRKHMFKKYKKYISPSAPELEELEPEKLKRMLVKGMEKYSDNLSEDIIWKLHLIFIYIIRKVK